MKATINSLALFATLMIVVFSCQKLGTQQYHSYIPFFGIYNGLNNGSVTIDCYKNAQVVKSYAIEEDSTIWFSPPSTFPPTIESAKYDSIVTVSGTNRRVEILGKTDFCRQIADVQTYDLSDPLVEIGGTTYRPTRFLIDSLYMGLKLVNE